MLEIKNLDTLLKQLDQWEGEVYELTRQIALGLSVKLFTSIVQKSAQYSGDYAANWKYSIGQPDYTFEPGAVSGDVVELFTRSSRVEGNGQAIGFARARARGKSGKFSLGDTIYITNSAAHDTPYAWLIEDGKIKFRQGNQGHTVARAFDEIRQYSTIDLKYAQILRRATL